MKQQHILPRPLPQQRYLKVLTLYLAPVPRSSFGVKYRRHVYYSALF
jgi:hypothetical protein